jgi:hypothetical protein
LALFIGIPVQKMHIKVIQKRAKKKAKKEANRTPRLFECVKGYPESCPKEPKLRFQGLPDFEDFGREISKIWPKKLFRFPPSSVISKTQAAKK